LSRSASGLILPSFFKDFAQTRKSLGTVLTRLTKDYLSYGKSGKWRMLKPPNASQLPPREGLLPWPVSRPNPNELSKSSRVDFPSSTPPLRFSPSCTFPLRFAPPLYSSFEKNIVVLLGDRLPPASSPRNHPSPRSAHLPGPSPQTHANLAPPTSRPRNESGLLPPVPADAPT